MACKQVSGTMSKFGLKAWENSRKYIKAVKKQYELNERALAEIELDQEVLVERIVEKAQETQSGIDDANNINKNVEVI